MMIDVLGVKTTNLFPSEKPIDHWKRWTQKMKKEYGYPAMHTKENSNPRAQKIVGNLWNAPVLSITAASVVLPTCLLVQNNMDFNFKHTAMVPSMRGTTSLS